MSRYIDADKLKDKKFHDVEKVLNNDSARIYMRGWNDAIDAIVENEPTADVIPDVILHDEPYPYRQPVKNKWLKRIDIVPVLECPECECRVLATDYSYAVGNRGYSFCPYCGADLREEREDDKE